MKNMTEQQKEKIHNLSEEQRKLLWDSVRLLTMQMLNIPGAPPCPIEGAELIDEIFGLGLCAACTERAEVSPA